MTQARYDAHADWYVDYTENWKSELSDHLPDSLAGQRVLDLCCGYGSLSRELGDRGAVVVGVDLSRRLIERARAIQDGSPAGISYQVGDATSVAWWDGEPFDRVVCNMALMDIDDLGAALSTVAAVLSPDGVFQFAIFHPCFPGSDGTQPSWPESGYASEGWWSTGERGVRGHVGAHHRTLSTYLNAVINSGLNLQLIIEPPAVVPTILIAECRPAV